MNFIMRLLGELEEKGVISRLPVTNSSPTFDKQGRMIGECNTCGCETITTCPDCKFFRCTRCACDVCKGE